MDKSVSGNNRCFCFESSCYLLLLFVVLYRSIGWFVLWSLVDLYYLCLFDT